MRACRTNWPDLVIRIGSCSQHARPLKATLRPFSPDQLLEFGLPSSWSRRPAQSSTVAVVAPRAATSRPRLVALSTAALPQIVASGRALTGVGLVSAASISSIDRAFTSIPQIRKASPVITHQAAR
jgi:hypothetical protein